MGFKFLTIFPLTPADIDPNAKIDTGTVYRGVETTQRNGAKSTPTNSLRAMTNGDIGDGIYFTREEWLAGTYGGGPRASLKAGTRTVFKYRIKPVFPDAVLWVFGGVESGGPLQLWSGTGVMIFEGDFRDIERICHREQAALVIGTRHSYGLNQICVREKSLVIPCALRRGTLLRR